MEEYGVDAVDLGLAEASDEEAERALLRRFLFAPPARQLVTGERNGLALDRVSKQLQALFTMLAGRRIDIAYSDPATTDNVRLYLPKAVPAPQEDTDTLLFRMMGLIQLGFTRWGALSDRALLAEVHRDWVLRSVYHLLTTRFVLRQWGLEYPGLRQDIERIALLDKAGTLRVNVMTVPREGLPGAFLPLYDGLVTCLNWKPPGADGEPARAAIRAIDRLDSIGGIAELARGVRDHFRRLRLGPPPLPYFVGIIRPEWILADLSRDIAYENEWKKGNKPLRQLLEAMARKGIAAEVAAPVGPGPRVGFRQRMFAKLTGPDMSASPAYGALRDAHVQRARAPREDEAGLPDKPGEDGGRWWDEWNDATGSYIFDAVKVFEPEAPTGPLGGYERIVAANRRQIQQIRRRFEELRVEERWLHGQRDGSDLDLNRAVLAFTDLHAGQDPDERIYKRFVRARQGVAILTMVDTSGSTQGHVIHLEQEAMVLFAEGLRTLDYPHAFYGFGNTHPTECQLWRIKGFDEAYGEPVFKRLGNLRPNGATRMGAFIRHAGALLAARPQSRRILLLVSDGKPEDRGEYRGKYGIRDAAMAVAEVGRHGVHVHCISLDAADDADRYLTEIFGKGKFLKIDHPDSLPMRLPELFRGLIR